MSSNSDGGCGCGCLGLIIGTVVALFILVTRTLSAPTIGYMVLCIVIPTVVFWFVGVIMDIFST